MTDPRNLQGPFTIDPSHSSVGFVVRHAMITKVRGSFPDFSGSAHLDGANPEASKVEVRINTASVETRSADRDAHLRSGDFFDVETYPTMTFTSTDVKAVSDDTVHITGDLTIKDVTKPVTIPFSYSGAAVDPFGNTRVGWEGAVDINRKDWGLTWNAALEAGGVLVSEKVKLEFDISTIKQA